jgi:hypothetical protein
MPKEVRTKTKRGQGVTLKIDSEKPSLLDVLFKGRRRKECGAVCVSKAVDCDKPGRQGLSGKDPTK